jgi:hypothetical protein
MENVQKFTEEHFLTFIDMFQEYNLNFDGINADKTGVFFTGIEIIQ